MLKIIKNWINIHRAKEKYCTGKREPFFDLAAKYLPSQKSAIIVDVGSGYGEFAKHLDLKDKYSNLFLLDGNKKTVDFLKKEFKNTLFYIAPGRLPFDNLSVGFLHCSHFIEHLYPDDLYKFLLEVDRVLCKDAVLVVSTPLIWPRFYDDLSHIRPYNPQVFINYMTSGSRGNPSAEIISKNYLVESLVYRYKIASFEGRWNSKYLLINMILEILNVLIIKIGFYKSIKNGYTLILRKGN